MLEVDQINLDDVVIALNDGERYERRWLIDSRTGEVTPWIDDPGLVDQQVDLEDLDPEIIVIDSTPSGPRYRDMVDFINRVGDARSAEQLARAIRGKGAFRRFGNELHWRHEQLIAPWRAFRDARDLRRAAGWLADNGLIDEASADRVRAEHPDPPVP